MNNMYHHLTIVTFNPSGGLTDGQITGNGTLGTDGYLMDFGDIKKVVRSLCKELNEYFICPMKSTDLLITKNEISEQLCLECEDGTKFSFPLGDCKMLPIWHSSSEQIAHYFWCMIVRRVGLDALSTRHITSMEISVLECPAQAAIFRSCIPSNEEELIVVEEMLSVGYSPMACSSKQYIKDN